MKTVLINLLDLILSGIIGFFINLSITSNLITLFFSGNYNIYVIVFFIALIIQIALVFSVIKLIRNKHLDKITYFILIILYTAIMMLLLFGRQGMEISINLNPLSLLNIFNNSDELIQSILNIIFFMPMGYFIKDFSLKKSFIISISGILIIELMQLILKRGIFDINDIILNLIGVYIVYYLTNKYNISLVKQ